MWLVLRASTRSLNRQAPRCSRRNFALQEAPCWSPDRVRRIASFPRRRDSAPRFSRTLCVAATPLIVVLDLDECLVHSTDFSSSSEGLRQAEASRPENASAGGGIQQYRASFRDDAGRVASCVVLKREGVDEFLASCCAAYTTYIFTAGTKVYADAVLDKLDPKNLLAGRFYRTDCKPVRVADGTAQGRHVQYLKDLEAVAKKTGRSGDFSRMVLVDNNWMSFVCQPRNGIPVPDFLGQPDDTLEKVLRLLRRLSDEEQDDVREYLNNLFGIEATLAPVKAQLLGPSSETSKL